MHVHGAELSIRLFPAATWRGCHADQAGRAEYPGLRPEGSWTLSPDGDLHGLDPAGAGWRDRDTGDPVDISGRRLVLAYGSNPDPAKLRDKADFFGGEEIIAVRAAVPGWAAVWCDARRADGSVVATLARVPGWLEVHPVMALTGHQLAAMDIWEGHPNCYRRSGFEDPVLLESGQWRDDVEVYLGTAARRPPLIVGGRHLLVSEVPHAHVDGLVDP